MIDRAASSALEHKLSEALDCHRHGKLKRAEALYRKILKKQPDNDEALHLLGVLLHQTERSVLAEVFIKRAIMQDPVSHIYLYNLAEVQRTTGAYGAAIRSYKKAIAICPQEADYYFGLGNAYSEKCQWAYAAEAFEAAVRLVPGVPQFHANLGSALLESGDLQGAIDCFRRAVSLEPDNADFRYCLATALDDFGAADKAIKNYQHAISLNSELPVAYSNLARLQYRSGQIKTAEESYRRALSLDGSLSSALFGLANILRDRGDYDSAIRYYRRLIEQDAENVNAISLLGDCYAKQNRYGKAVEFLDKALSLDSNNAEAHFNLGICLQAMGRFEEAGDSHRRALSIKPELTEAAYNLSLISSQSLSDDELLAMAGQADAGIADMHETMQINIRFALAKAFHDRNRYDEAFEHLKLGNDLKASLNEFEPSVYEDYIDRVIATTGVSFFAERRNFGERSKMPIFIVGMPRSGSTLVEQIISSHPLVYGAGELNDMRILAKRLPQLLQSKTEDPEILTEISAEMSRKLAGEHLCRLTELSAGAHYVCDKMLGNFLKLGLIFLMFPQARIIHCIRNPLDTGLSCYFQNFARGLKFTYRLDHFGIAYLGYQRLMQHWRQVLPLPMLEVHYENLVADQEAVSRRLIDFCGLEWDDRCLDFYRQSRGVKTASFWQVRQPLYRSSVNRWQQYREYLQPLIDELGPAAYEDQVFLQ